MAMSPLSRNTWACPPAVQSLLTALEGDDLSVLAGKAGREADRIVRVVPALVPQELCDLEQANQLVLAASAAAARLRRALARPPR
jgi:hypothetical protein